MAGSSDSGDRGGQARPVVKASVVIPTYNRGPALGDLLAQLVGQSVGRDAFEVIVVDDGSQVDPRPSLGRFVGPLHLHVERQTNAGAARARQRGAGIARGELLIFLDDDMKIAASFVAAHLTAHEGRPRAAVVGRLRALPSIDRMSLFERYHARMLDLRAAQADETGAAMERPENGLPGPELFGGNLSIPRALFFEAGGFDADLRLCEDVDLGIRLERIGVRIFLSHEAQSVHASDPMSTERWLHRSNRDGVYATRVAHKHPACAAASPFWHVSRIAPLLRPVLAVSAAAPRIGAVLARVVMGVAQAADRVGWDHLAAGGTTLVYGLEFCRGVRKRRAASSPCSASTASTRRPQPPEPTDRAHPCWKKTAHVDLSGLVTRLSEVRR